jgi:hypothetical protein
MKIDILDGYTENPGDLSWSGFEALGELTVYDRTPPDQTIGMIGRRSRPHHKTAIPAGTEASRAIRTSACWRPATTWSTRTRQEKRHSRHEIRVRTTAVAQFAFASAGNLPPSGAHSERVRAGEWARRGDFLLLGIIRSSSMPEKRWHHRIRAIGQLWVRSPRPWDEGPGFDELSVNPLKTNAQNTP